MGKIANAEASSMFVTVKSCVIIKEVTKSWVVLVTSKFYRDNCSFTQRLDYTRSLRNLGLFMRNFSYQIVWRISCRTATFCELMPCTLFYLCWLLISIVQVSKVPAKHFNSFLVCYLISFTSQFIQDYFFFCRFLREPSNWTVKFKLKLSLKTTTESQKSKHGFVI